MRDTAGAAVRWERVQRAIDGRARGYMRRTAVRLSGVQPRVGGAGRVVVATARRQCSVARQRAPIRSTARRRGGAAHGSKGQTEEDSKDEENSRMRA